MKKRKILVVEDEKNIVELLKINLEGFGYEVIAAYNGMEAITKTNIFHPDLILLDLMLPDIDGLQICQMIRLNDKTKDIPIIMITARSEESDKVSGLSAGADDYITKPFGIRELEARIKTVLRRSDKSDIIEDNLDTNILNFKDIVIDTTLYQVKKNNNVIDLTLSEFKILKALVENQNKVMTREDLFDVLGTEKSKTENRSIDVHIRNIRKKLGEDSIETIRGIGYVIK